MTLPTIHINGTAASSLMGQLEATHSALLRAERALELAAPNARDYYPQGDKAFSVARTEHEQRMAAILAVRVDIGNLMNHVAEFMR